MVSPSLVLLPLLVGLPAPGIASCSKIPTKQATKLNLVKPSKKERENGRDRGRGTHNVPQYMLTVVGL